MNAVQNMQSYEEMAEAHVQHLQKLVPATTGRYSGRALTPSLNDTNAASDVFFDLS
jgi:hypothetical protein